MTDEQAHGEVVGMDHVEDEIARLSQENVTLQARLAQVEQEREQAIDLKKFYKAELDRADKLMNEFGVPNIAIECGDMLKPVDERIALVFAERDAALARVKEVERERDEAVKTREGYDKWLQGGVYYTNEEHARHIAEHQALQQRVTAIQKAHRTLTLGDFDVWMEMNVHSQALQPPATGGGR